MRYFLILIAIMLNEAFAEDKTPIDNACREVRAAFYMSDYGTSGRVADVNICDKKIIEILNEKSILINIPLEKKEANIIPQGIIYQLILDLSYLKNLFQIDCNYIKCSGILSETLAKDNNTHFKDFVKKKFNINLFSIDISEEPILGFLGIIANNYIEEQKNNRLVILDLRHNIYQISEKYNGKISTFKMPYGPLDFKDDVIKKVKSYQTNFNKTINPLSAKEYEYSLTIAKNKLVAHNLESELFSYLKTHNEVFGSGDIIGDIKNVIVGNDEGYLTRVHILNSIQRFIDLDNETITKLYPLLHTKTDDIIINLIFLYSVMNFLNIDKINVVKKVSDVDGLLVNQDYWSQNMLSK